MARKKKEKTLSSELAERESALETKISKIENISDPIEQLFQFRALMDSGEVTYDEKKVIPWDADRKAEWKFVKSTAWGFWTGLPGGTAFGIALASTAVLTGGTALVAGLGFWAAGTAVGALIGRKRRNSPEEKHATEMAHLASRINWDVEVKTIEFKNLTSNFENKWSMDVLAKSSHFEEIKKAFPEIVAEFNRQAKIAPIEAKAAKIKSDRQAKIAAQQEAFLAQHHLSPEGTCGTRLSAG